MLVLGVLSAVALSGCAPAPAERRGVADGLADPTSPPTHPPRPVPTAPTTAAPIVVEVQPDLDEIAARHAGVQPREWGLVVPGVATRLATAYEGSAPRLAITLDACGGPGGDGVDQALIDLLVANGVPATLFLNSRWIEAHRDLAAQLAASDLFELANHGTAHRPLSVTGQSAYGIAGTASVGEVVDEVWGNHRVLHELTGTAPRWFRSGTAHYDEVAVAIASELGEQVVGFDVNGDAGATFSAAQVHASLMSRTPGSIVISHMNQPNGSTAEGFATALPLLLAAGTRFVHLDGGLI